MRRLVIIDHPLVQVKLGVLRDRNTPSTDFRRALRETAALMFFLATADLPLTPDMVQTPPRAPAPARDCNARSSSRRSCAPGWACSRASSTWWPTPRSPTSACTATRETLRPVTYYAKVPPEIEAAEVILLDPMLATGHSAAAAVTALKAKGAAHVRFLCLVSCPAGIEHFHSQHPDVPIYTAAVDERLDENGYIVPGLGDAGDRFFGT